MTDRLTDFARSPTPSEKSTSAGRPVFDWNPQGIQKTGEIGLRSPQTKRREPATEWRIDRQHPQGSSPREEPTSAGESRPDAERRLESARSGFGQSGRGSARSQNRAIVGHRMASIRGLPQGSQAGRSRPRSATFAFWQPQGCSRKVAKGGLRSTSRAEPPSGVFRNRPKRSAREGFGFSNSRPQKYS
jgi:hypothetical protein